MDDNAKMNGFPFLEYSRFTSGDMTLTFYQKDNHMAFGAIPAGMESKIPVHLSDLTESIACRGLARAKRCTFSSLQFENMIQYHTTSESMSSCYFTGDSMMEAGDARALRFVSQIQKGTVVETVMEPPDGSIRAVQTLTMFPGEPYFRICTRLENRGEKPVTVDLLDSFVLGMLSPFAPDDGPDRYRLHRYTAWWGAEGRHVASSIESLGLERAWVPFVGRAERFGQRSSLTVKHYFPTVGFEDLRAGVVWAVQLEALGPWQLELSRRGDFLNLSGGLPDGEFAGWERTIAPGESFSGLPAVLTVVRGSMQTALNRLTRYPVRNHIGYAPSEETLPVIFNEYCTTWCEPEEERLLKLADLLKGHGIGYFVMDDGWYRSPGADGSSKGDWLVSPERFPHGMRHYCDEIRRRGMVPGIWFEFEQCSRTGSRLGREHPEYALRLHGTPYTTEGDIWPLDFRKEEVQAVMWGKVADFLRGNGIGYVKIDYNYAVIGADTEHGSAVAGLQEQLEAVEAFFMELKRKVPGLVLEVCASGGHRLSTRWMMTGDMASFSDNHEDVSIPLTAAGTALQIPLRSNQVWAVLHEWDDERRLRYSLTAGFLGRLCLSGGFEKMDGGQLALAFEAVNFARTLTPLLLEGKTQVEQHLTSESWNHPCGYQLFRRTGTEEEYLVLHTFADAPNEVEVPITAGAEIVRTFAAGGISFTRTQTGLRVGGLADFTGVALLLRKEVGK